MATSFFFKLETSSESTKTHQNAKFQSPCPPRASPRALVVAASGIRTGGRRPGADIVSTLAEAPAPASAQRVPRRPAKMKSVICAVALLFSSAHAMGKIDETCPGQIACGEDGSACAAGQFCNFNLGTYGSCDECVLVGHSDLDCDDRGLPSAGVEDCLACCDPV